MTKNSPKWGPGATWALGTHQFLLPAPFYPNFRRLYAATNPFPMGGYETVQPGPHPTPVLGHFGPFWAILGHFGSFWVILGHFGSFRAIWVILAHFGSFWPPNFFLGFFFCPKNVFLRKNIFFGEIFFGFFFWDFFFWDFFFSEKNFFFWDFFFQFFIKAHTGH